MSDLELHYQNVLFIIFKLVGFYTQAEYHTSEGRIDLVVKAQVLFGFYRVSLLTLAIRN